MSGPGSRAQSVGALSIGSAKRDDIIGFKARCASAVRIARASESSAQSHKALISGCVAFAACGCSSLRMTYGWPPRSGADCAV